jgi:UDP-N-acetylmuramoyl-tripeptide--D-alanyl-D-alanine ligase
MNWQIYIPYLYMILLSIMLFVPIKQSLHMFQQNRYELVRFLPWIKQSMSASVLKILLYSLPFALYLAVFFISEHMIWIILFAISIMITIVLHILDNRKKYVKPLVFTHRVLRQLLVFYVIWLVVFLVVHFIQHIYAWAIISILILPLTWLLVLLVAVITDPLESIVKKGYIFLAKRKLKKQPNLIKIGITGSYGKTTSKHIVHDILSTNYYCLMTPASYNTPMGITITIRNHLKPLHQVFICEMGADKVNEIGYLSKLVKPQFGVVTAVGPQHLNTFKKIENIVIEKMKLIENLPLSGVGVVNLDNEHIRNYRIKNKCLILSVGIVSKDVDFKANNIEYTPEGTTFEITTKDQVSVPFKTKLLGEHNVLNILISVALGKQLGIDWEPLQQSVSSLRQVKNRLEVKQMFGFRVIDNSFNSNPISAKNSLDVLSMMPNKRFIITPGMIELGDQQSHYNKQFGLYMKGRADVVVLIGKRQTQPIMEGLKESGYDMDNVVVVDSMLKAFDIIKTQASLDDTILIENDLPDAFIH